MKEDNSGHKGMDPFHASAFYVIGIVAIVALMAVAFMFMIGKSGVTATGQAMGDGMGGGQWPAGGFNPDTVRGLKCCTLMDGDKIWTSTNYCVLQQNPRWKEPSQPIFMCGSTGGGGGTDGGGDRQGFVCSWPVGSTSNLCQW